MKAFRRRAAVMCGRPVTGTGTADGMYGSKDIGSTHAGARSMRARNGGMTATAGAWTGAGGEANTALDAGMDMGITDREGKRSRKNIAPCAPPLR